MNWHSLLIFLFLTVVSLKANNNDVINRILRLIKRRYSNHRTAIRAPRHPEHLPPAEPMLPGHTLIRPSLQMLKSSVKYPRKDLDTAVYGNLGNLGITYGKSPHRILYTGFRRTNHNILELTIRQAVRNLLRHRRNKRTADVVIIEATASDEQPTLASLSQDLQLEQSSEKDNDASEILESSEEEKESNARRSKHDPHAKRNKYRTRNRLYPWDNSTESSASSSDTSETSDYEKNPGNPFTLHKGKYEQNWMWNHFMDGDHMNINPFAPQFSSAGPSGVGLFFGRKWWYFNQDDYKPLRNQK